MIYFFNDLSGKKSVAHPDDCHFPVEKA